MWVYLKKERFPKGKHTKLLMRKVSPCKVLRNSSKNSHEVDLPTHLGISLIFNITDLTPYKGDEEEDMETYIKEFEEDVAALPTH